MAWLLLLGGFIAIGGIAYLIEGPYARNLHKQMHEKYSDLLGDHCERCPKQKQRSNLIKYKGR